MKKRMIVVLTAIILVILTISSAYADVTFTADWTKALVEGHFQSNSDVAYQIKHTGIYESIGAQFHEPDKEEFNADSPALYTAKLNANISIYSERDINSVHVVEASSSGIKVEVLYVGTYWCVVRSKGKLGYSKREKLTNFECVAPNTLPYGVQKHTYVARTARVTYVRIGMSHQDHYWVVLKPGTTLTIWKIQDGWAIVNYHRNYGYIDLNDLTDLVPVSPTDTPITSETPIAAYTSYYGMAQTESNLSRLNNIQVACAFLRKTIQPGETYNCNKVWGPYQESKGYREAPVLVDGVSQPGFGGGTCQVSSTVYNALLQLPGIQIINRRAHGANCAPYLPHGVDAAVGRNEGNPPQNLIFRNNYDFPIRIEPFSNDDGALCMLIYRAD